jgi:uncharacterized membrane protein
MFVSWALLLHPDVEFTYYRSATPFPNQRVARRVSYVAGIVLILGGLWGLWFDVRLARRSLTQLMA